MNLAEYALSWVGANEKLGTHKVIIDLYNTIRPIPRGYKVKYTDAWCMAFASACNVGSERILNFPNECSCAKAVEKLIKSGDFVEDDKYTPLTNDLVFYHWGHSGNTDCRHNPNHVGIVLGCINQTIWCVEGNYNDSVKIRCIPVNYEKIRGFGTLNHHYSVASDITSIARMYIDGKFGNDTKTIIQLLGYQYRDVMTEVNNLHEDYNVGLKSVNDVAKEVIQGKWGNNPERRRKLTAEGYDYQAIQDIVNAYYRKEKK